MLHTSFISFSFYHHVVKLDWKMSSLFVLLLNLLAVGHATGMSKDIY